MSISFDAGRLTEPGDDLGDPEFLRQTVGEYLKELPGLAAMMHHVPARGAPAVGAGGMISRGLAVHRTVCP